MGCSAFAICVVLSHLPAAGLMHWAWCSGMLDVMDTYAEWVPVLWGFLEKPSYEA